MLDHDLDLTARDFQGLSDRDAVRAFFARLGYGVERGRATDPLAEGMPERLAEGVRHLELLAADADEFTFVYLIELASVTVGRIAELATHFKNKPGNTLAVLTSDYRRLDFVLFDYQLPRDGSSQRMAQVVPRRLVLDRDDRDEGRRVVIRRALRRFSWTEPDGLAQWDKLRSAFAIGEWSERYFDNRGLFSDYYLTERLPYRPEWGDDSGLRGELQALRVALHDARQTYAAKPDEAALRAGLLEPLFAQLGFRPAAQKGPDSQDHETPDYRLDDPTSGEPLAVALTYAWDRFLDGPSGSLDDPTAAENPGAAVLSVLERDGVDWAIVTNGKQWRLYTAKTASRATNFFQIDLEEAAADSDPTALRYFRLLFRADAFRPQEVVVEGEERQRSFLEDLLEGSRAYAQSVGDRLKERVFEDVFPILAEGFIDDLRRAGVELDDAALGQVFDGTLTLLYRLLFLLYAESRDLLPVRQPGGYWERSLSTLKARIAGAAGSVESQRDIRLADGFRADGFGLWEHLQRLFAAIDVGEAALNVPPYNGGLFTTEPSHLTDGRERATAAFLAERRVGDRALARALDRIARDPDERTHGLAFIDFKSLGVRQLGSIYEGLLEFQVRVASETLAVCKRSGSELILPLAEARATKGVTIQREGRGQDAAEQLLEPGTVYLTNSKLERKVSGSYYTPEDLVAYIVEHTVGPVLETRLDGLRDELNQACADFRRRSRAGGPDALSDADRGLVGRLFDFRVLDPAMGSGHFLVSAVDFVADRLIDFLNGFPGNPVERLLQRTRADIVAAAAGAGVIIDEDRLTDVNLLKRHVLKRCLFGVDLNPMAVELAKVSLWLHCFTLGAPLSFLGHHFKVGNSLVGEIDAEQVIAPGSERWGRFQTVVGHYLAVSRRADTTAAEVAASRDDFRVAEQILADDRRRAHVATARHFEGWDDRTVGYTQQLAEGREQEGYQAEYQRALELADTYAFFHWPLEFPEAWLEARTHDGKVYQARKRPGFDAVIGNPPWERTKLQESEFFAGRSQAVMTASTAAARRKAIAELEADDPDLWAEYQAALAEAAGFGSYVRACDRYPQMRSGDTNLYQLFAEHALGVINAVGRFGMVLPSGIATDYSTRKFFGALVERDAVAEVLDFENRKCIFRDVDSRFKFTLFIGAGGQAGITQIRCAFFLHGIEDLEADGRVVHLGRDDLRLVNPNTLTMPVLRHQRDADLLSGIYRRLPVLIREDGKDEVNPWGVSYVRMLDMTNDSGHFVETAELLEQGGRRQEDGSLLADGERYLRLYEGKMIHQFDHRFASVVGSVGTDRPIGSSEETTREEHADPRHLTEGRFWVKEPVVEAAFGDYGKPYVLAFRDIARATDERTCIASIIPRVGVGNTAPLVQVDAGPERSAAVSAWMCSLANDYTIRQKLSSTHLNWFYLKQQPIPTPAQVAAIGAGGDTLGWIAERVLELSYTAWDLAGFARELGHEGPPFGWDEERRLHLRCQLDALFFHLYGLGPDEIEYIAETFWIVRRNEEKRWGRYRSKGLMVGYWEAYEAGEWGWWGE